MAEPDKEVTTNETEDAVSDTGKETGTGDTKTSGLASELMKNPQILAAVQDRLGGIVGASSGYIESLPPAVKRRIKSLKKIQSETIRIEGKFYEEVHELECKYADKYSSLYEKRRNIICGSVEPTDSDCDWPSDEEKEDEEVQLAGAVKTKVIISNETTDKKEDAEENTTGIPNFWLTTFKNVDIISEMVQDHDEPILLCLRDISVKFLPSDPIGFMLEFHFDENEYFTNAVLTKKYVMRAEPDPTDPLSYDGPEIIKCEGCKVDWKTGKDVTTKTIRKKQKHKGRGTTRTINKTVQIDSFFNFFNPPKLPEESETDLDDETEALLAADFEIGHLIRERIVPRAVLYFTGEALDEDDYDEEGDEEEGDEEDENDPDFDPENNKSSEQCKQQ